MKYTEQKKNYWTEDSTKIGLAIEELRSILKTYHYESKEQHISKNVVTSLENLLGSLLK
jgi:hypothetical protein